jgi:hypothetical protein
MAFLEINPDLRRLTSAAERIATALEAIALAEYGIAPKPKVAATDLVPMPDEGVGYSTDMDTLRGELEQLVRPGAVSEREGAVVEEEIGDVLRPHS